VPARDIETITLKGLIDTIRGAGREMSVVDGTVHSVPQLDRVMAAVDKAIGESLGGQTLKQLVLAPREDDKAKPFAVDSRRTAP
jgi:hypothetical protein